MPLAGPAVPAPPEIESKEAEARQVLAQIQGLDSSLEHVIEAYNAAEVELDQVVAAQKLNERRLTIARSNLGAAQGTLEARLVQLYQNGNPDLVEIILGSSSLDEILDGIETAARVSDQDAQILEEVRKFRDEIERREAELEKARERQEQVVAERAAKRQEIESTLAERQELLASIKDQIAEMRAAERRRQERLEAAAQARLDAQSSGGGGGGGGLAPPSKYGGVVGIAMQYLGIPYLWGGSSPSTGFDCSGFVMYVYSRVGVSLPRVVSAQYTVGVAVSRSELQPGDIVFFNSLGHNGIYIGGNQFIHSPHTGDVVKISSITGYYSSGFVGARRVL
ncbi:MAG TPA: NlpC/P60 family protein [Gaiellaceae bacterium]|nr:NlpC/P60 family protein [Gaiellaceae bacterium]